MGGTSLQSFFSVFLISKNSRFQCFSYISCFAYLSLFLLFPLSYPLSFLASFYPALSVSLLSCMMCFTILLPLGSLSKPCPSLGPFLSSQALLLDKHIKNLQLESAQGGNVTFVFLGLGYTITLFYLDFRLLPFLFLFNILKPGEAHFNKPLC